jgi:hypothetical protein
LFSEQNVEKYAGSSDESCLSSTELDNSVSKGEKGRAQFFHLTVNLAGKKARSTGDQVKMSKPLVYEALAHVDSRNGEGADPKELK